MEADADYLESSIERIYWGYSGIAFAVRQQFSENSTFTEVDEQTSNVDELGELNDKSLSQKYRKGVKF